MYHRRRCRATWPRTRADAKDAVNRRASERSVGRTLTLPPRRRLRLRWMPPDLSTASERGPCPFSRGAGCKLLKGRAAGGLLRSRSGGELGVKYAGSLLRRSQLSIFGLYSSCRRSDASSPAAKAKERQLKAQSTPPSAPVSAQPARTAGVPLRMCPSRMPPHLTCFGHESGVRVAHGCGTHRWQRR